MGTMSALTKRTWICKDEELHQQVRCTRQQAMLQYNTLDASPDNHIYESIEEHPSLDSNYPGHGNL
jgi:hypothetical protein